jgi:hypothetical protein
LPIARDLAQIIYHLSSIGVFRWRQTAIPFLNGIQILLLFFEEEGFDCVSFDHLIRGLEGGHIGL